MNRRELLQLSAAAVGAGAFKTGFSQEAAAPPMKKIRIDAYSRTLHWLRKPEELTEACHQIGNSTIDLTVRAYPGHVQPEKVTSDLPPFVKTLEQNGITVTVLGADIVDDKTPYLEEMLGTASSLGIRYNWWRGFSMDYAKPYPPQIEALKPRLEKLVKAQEKYGMKAMYHPQGGPFFDQLELIRNFDPRYVSIHFDTGHWMQIAQSNMAAMIVMAGPYVGGFVWKDGVVEKRDLASGPPAGAATAPAGAPDGGARGGRGGGGPGAGYNGWGTRQVPVGTGMVDFAMAARTLKTIEFDGPTECRPEWTGLGGAESGRDTLTLPRETVIGLLKRDYDTIHAALAAAGIA
jgi:sugar phosphate isomerase/epimerase